MKCEFEKVLHGITKYIDSEVYTQMNELQEFAARVIVGRVLANEKELKEKIIGNSYIKTFGFVDCDGKVDVDGLAKDIKREISRQGKIEMVLPMFGKLTFVPSDVDVLYSMITGEGFGNDNH